MSDSDMSDEEMINMFDISGLEPDVLKKASLPADVNTSDVSKLDSAAMLKILEQLS